jgi:hypothetical protein
MSFGDLDDYMHPHSYIRLENNHVLATFQYHGGHDAKSDSGGLLEINEHGHIFRSSSAMDPAAKTELIRPYSLVAIPTLDRVVTTNASMHFTSDGNARSVQFWRLSDLTLLRPSFSRPGPAARTALARRAPTLL